MTLIITYINRHGIVHASDSNLTGADGRDAGTGQKTFPIKYLNAGLTVAGAYSVANTPMDKWMSDFIQSHQNDTGLDLQKFSNLLKDELQNKMLRGEKLNGSLIHIAGYVEKENKSHPEFWFVRNVHRMNETTGEYENIDENFEISEDFWGRDCPKQNLMQAFKNQDSFARQIYFNGFTPGRIGYSLITDKLDEFFLTIWRIKDWKFRQPKSLDETERLVKLYMLVVNDLFILSDYNAHYIGGGIQSHLIPQPSNIVDNC
jgi:hypothetical protein